MYIKIHLVETNTVNWHQSHLKMFKILGPNIMTLTLKSWFSIDYITGRKELIRETVGDLFYVVRAFIVNYLKG